MSGSVGSSDHLSHSHDGEVVVDVVQHLGQRIEQVVGQRVEDEIPHEVDAAGNGLPEHLPAVLDR